MKRYISSSSFFLVAISFLVLAVFFSFPSYVTLGNNSNNTVKVNAQIQPSQVLKIQGKSSGGSRTKALIPVDLGHAQKRGEGGFVSTGNFTLNLGSNTDWQLFARIVNLEETRALLRDSGWKLERFSLNLGGKETELNESPGKMDSGSYGKHELEISFEVIISKSGSPSDEGPPLAELKNVIAFAVK